MEQPGERPAETAPTTVAAPITSPAPATSPDPATLPAPAAADVIESWQQVEPTAAAVEVNPRTGEPWRPLLIWVSTISGLCAVAVMISALLWSFWNAVSAFSSATWLFAQFPTPTPAVQVGLVAGATAATLIAAAPTAITAFYGWWGYPWTRVSAIISAVASLLMLLLNPLGWVAIGLTMLAGGLLWLPRASRFFTEWQLRRHPMIAFGAPTTSVQYGPLPKYRRD